MFTFAIGSSVFKVCLKVLRSSADLQLYDSELQIEGVLTVNAFADSVTTYCSSVIFVNSTHEAKCR